MKAGIYHEKNMTPSFSSQASVSLKKRLRKKMFPLAKDIISNIPLLNIK